MSSRNRRNRRRDKRRNQHLNRPIPAPAAWPNRTPLPGHGGTNEKARGWKTYAILAALVVVGGLMVYAINATKTATIASVPGAASQAAKVPPTAATRPAVAAQAKTPLISTGPRIQFANPIYDFGKVTGDELVNCMFVFTNAGNALLELSEVAPACGCMKMGEWSRKVQPGKTGSIAVQYDSHHYTGPFAKSVFVTCNDSNQPEINLEIKGTVWRAIELTPASAVINVNAETPSNAATVRIVSNLDQPLTITNIQNDNSAFAVELQTNQPG